MLAPKSWGQRSVVQRQGASHLVGSWERLFIGVRERLPPVVGEQSTHRYWRPIGTRRSGCHGDHRDCHSTREREYQTPHLPPSHRPPPQTGRSLCGCNAVSFWPMCWNETSWSSWLLLVPYATSRPKRRTRANRGTRVRRDRGRVAPARRRPSRATSVGLQPARFTRLVWIRRAPAGACRSRRRSRAEGPPVPQLARSWAWYRPGAHDLNPSTARSG